MNVIPPSEVEFIERAANYLENPSFIVRFGDLVGKPLEAVTKLAPEWVSDAVDISLRRVFDVALVTLPSEPVAPTDFVGLAERAWWAGYRHSAMTAVTGGVGGLFGTVGLCVELPITMGIILRSMGAIAGAYAEDLTSTNVRLECLSLFAMGGPSLEDDEMDSSYLTLRASMSSLVSSAAKFVAHTPADEVLLSIKNGTAPAIVKLLGRISKRFELSVLEKVMAQAIPVIGAVGGATVNVTFAEHFNEIARYHFGLRNLERRWGPKTIRVIYQEAIDNNAKQARQTISSTPNFGYRGNSTFAASAAKPR